METPWAFYGLHLLRKLDVLRTPRTRDERDRGRRIEKYRARVHRFSRCSLSSSLCSRYFFSFLIPLVFLPLFVVHFSCRNVKRLRLTSNPRARIQNERDRRRSVTFHRGSPEARDRLLFLSWVMATPVLAARYGLIEIISGPKARYVLRNMHRVPTLFVVRARSSLFTWIIPTFPRSGRNLWYRAFLSLFFLFLQTRHAHSGALNGREDARLPRIHGASGGQALWKRDG